MHPANPQQGPLRTAVTRRLEDLRWRLLLVGLAAVALIGIPVALVAPDTTPLLWFALLSVAANGPLSPIFPVAFEPLIIEAAKYSSAIWVTLVGLAVYMLMESLNYVLYASVLRHRRLDSLRQHRWSQRSVDYFARSPFLTVWVFAFTPLPFWVARLMAIFHHYRFAHYFAATALGRLPRIYLYAWLGASFQVPGVVLLLLAAGATLLLVVWRSAKGRPVLAETVLDAAEDPEEPPAAR
jgi:hypothetical protein